MTRLPKTRRPHFVAGYGHTHSAWALKLALSSSIPSLHRPSRPAPRWSASLTTFMLTSHLPWHHIPSFPAPPQEYSLPFRIPLVHQNSAQLSCASLSFLPSLVTFFVPKSGAFNEHPHIWLFCHLLHSCLTSYPFNFLNVYNSSL